MKSTDYIRAYAMIKKGKGFDTYYERRFENNDKIETLSLHKLEMTDECFFVKQVFHKKRLNTKTGMVGVWGEPKMTFGIKDDIFDKNNKQEFEME